jgi:hypothetical protein
MGVLNLDAFASTPLAERPFQFLVVPEFVAPEALGPIISDFPAILHPGLMPLAELSYGPAFAALIEEIRSRETEEAFSDKYGLDLSGMPLMITVRGRSQERDGRIHNDSVNKVVTALLYLNDLWGSEGGRLRMLNGPGDIEDAAAEVPPHGGTLASFRRSERSYHGHKPFTGVRRYVMFNWMCDNAVTTRELLRHRVSARIKRVLELL